MQHQSVLEQNRPIWKTVPIASAVVVGLMALGKNGCEPAKSQLHVPAVGQNESKIRTKLERCTSQFLRVGEYGLMRVPAEHLGTVAEKIGHRFGIWRNRHAHRLVDQSPFDRV